MDLTPDPSPDEPDRRDADRAFLRALGIAPDDDLVAGRVRPWREHPLLRFSTSKSPRQMTIPGLEVYSPLLPA